MKIPPKLQLLFVEYVRLKGVQQYATDEQVRAILTAQKRAKIKPWPQQRGQTGIRRLDLRCSACDGANFIYGNGCEWSQDGVRGYRCCYCDTIKPEAQFWPLQKDT